MRRILNWKVAACAAALLFVAGVAFLFIHEVQVGRSGRANYEDALKYEAGGDLERSARYFRKYLIYDPEDLDAKGRFADVLERMAKEPGERVRALQVREQILIQDPKRDAVRKKAFAIVRDLRLHPVVIRHATVLTGDHPDEAPLEDALAQSLQAL